MALMNCIMPDTARPFLQFNQFLFFKLIFYDNIMEMKTSLRIFIIVSALLVNSISYSQTEKDPITDLKNTNTIKMVMKNGRLYDGDTLDEIYLSARNLDTRE